MKRFLKAPLIAVALLLGLGASARATLISPDHVTWTYNFTPAAPAVTADGNPSAGVTFTNEPTKAAVGSSDIVATNLRVFSTAPGSSPDQITGSNGKYTISLLLTNTTDPGAPSTTFKFTGTLKGTFSAENANVGNTFGGGNTQTVQLGNYKFTVALTSYTPPGPPDQSNAGSMSAHVTVTAVDHGGPHPADVPEPSTMLLAGLGLTVLGAARWRRARARRLAASC
jgi:hypothetical protein